jgi:ATP-dependent RNA helicase DBP3
MPSEEDPKLLKKKSKKSKRDHAEEEPKKKSKKSKKEFSDASMDLKIMEEVNQNLEMVTKKEKKSKSKSSSFEYMQSDTLAQMSQETIQTFLEKNTITIDPMHDSLKPIFEFDQVSLPCHVTSALQAFTRPTPIQSVTWPPLLSGRDIIGIAATGSGKTMAFGIPAYVRYASSKTSPRVLVLSPTRELAMQIQEQFEKLGKDSNMKSVCLYGGVSKQDQKRLLKQGASVIVATPGRLMDLVEEGDACDLSGIQYWVLDEADRMLDFGFEEAIRKIASYLPESGKRQTAMFR